MLGRITAAAAVVSISAARILRRFAVEVPAGVVSREIILNTPCKLRCVVWTQEGYRPIAGNRYQCVKQSHEKNLHATPGGALECDGLQIIENP